MRARPLRTHALASALALLGAACVSHTPPAELLVLTEESAANRAMQTRVFETRDARELMSASAAALQDLGFQVEEAVPDVGFLRAAKERSAREYGQEIRRALILLVGALGESTIRIPVDLQQQIVASLVMQPASRDGARQRVRIVFYRVVWKGDGESSDRYGRTRIPPGEQRMEMIRDAEVYQQFFARLAKSVFLEAERI